ncbi:MAG: hypothetical protein KIT43_04125 [Bauldia sp.]|nr:hypothetical protein [Bauldia sp.]
MKSASVTSSTGSVSTSNFEVESADGSTTTAASNTATWPTIETVNAFLMERGLLLRW